MKLSQVADRIGMRVERDAAFESLGFLTHTMPAMLAFVGDQAYLALLEGRPHLCAVIATPELAAAVPPRLGLALAQDPRKAFYALHQMLATETDFYWRAFETEIAPDALVHPRAYVAPKNVRIGPRAVIEPNASVLERTLIGADVIVRAGCTIGTQGFEFRRGGEGIVPVAHAGGVRLGDRVEIQANSVVARAVFGGHTEIGDDTKLDNLVQIAHNVKIGRRCLIGSSVTIAGSTTVGDDVWIGPNATLSNGLTVGDGASVTLGSVVVRDVAPGRRVTGNFAVEHEHFMAFMRSFSERQQPGE